jgi:hypothetical protein
MHGWRAGGDLSCDRLYLLLRDLAEGSIRAIDQTVDVLVALAYQALVVSGAQPLTSGERCLMNVSTDALVRSSLRTVLSKISASRSVIVAIMQAPVPIAKQSTCSNSLRCPQREPNAVRGLLTSSPVTSSLRAPQPA